MGIYISAGTIVPILYSILLYVIGKARKDYTRLFYVLAAVPIIFGFLAAITYTVPLIGTIGLGWIFMAYLLIISERAVWAMTLRKVSGEKRAAWFFIIFFMPLIGWLIYWITETW